MRLTLFIILAFIFSSCWDKNIRPADELQPTTGIIKDTVDTFVKPRQTVINYSPASKFINTGSTTPQELLAFAKTLIGTPYKYASTDPAAGFDCSGFLTYVFNHFNIAVPRSSVDFTDVGRTVELATAKPGDLVLFTGTDSTNRLVGHIGIINSYENGEFNFIHSTSGKANGVTISALSKYYAFRFVKVIRIFPQNDL